MSILITGGTGSFGNTVLKRLLSTDVREIRIFSRDEKKQWQSRSRRQSGGAASGTACRQPGDGSDYATGGDGYR